MMHRLAVVTNSGNCWLLAVYTHGILVAVLAGTATKIPGVTYAQKPTVTGFLPYIRMVSGRVTPGILVAVPSGRYRPELQLKFQV